MNADVGPLLGELKQALGTLYASRLKGVYLFGSFARGDADDESDVDVLIILDEFESHVAEIRRTSQVVSDISLRRGVSISRAFLREREWTWGEGSFLANVRSEAIPV